MATATAAVQAHVSIGLCETPKRRSSLARPDRARGPLRNAAAANLDWLVCASVSALDSENLLPRNVHHRAGGPFPVLRAAALAHDRRHPDSLASSVYSAHWQLQLLQLAHTSAVLDAIR